MIISDEQVARLRDETPSCNKVIHFNHAGASLMPDPVFRAVTEHLELERKIGGYEAAAVDYAREIGLPAIEERITYVANQLRTSLSEIDGVNVLDLGTGKCGIVTFDVEGESPTDLSHRLRESGVNISVTGPESAQLDFAERDITELARASVHYLNTETEIERFCDLLAH